MSGDALSAECEYLGWINGATQCSCGRAFDSVESYNAHVGFPPESRTGGES